MIELHNVSMLYPSGKGIIDVDFSVHEGQILGYLGPNGSGKTTTIRCLLGFTKPDTGNCTINGLDCVKSAPEIQKNLGYIPGEISFFDGMSGNDFLTFMGKMRKMKDFTLQKELIERFELDPSKKIKKFSKGMKQKLGIVTALMHNPDVLILDEPTSGLDPLMQNRFVDFILEQKKTGKTILLSSHMFEEVNRTCDEIIIIKEGRLVEKNNIHTIKEAQRKVYIVKFKKQEDLNLISQSFKVNQIFENTAEIAIRGDEIDRLTKALSAFEIESLDSKVQTLEEIFLNFYAAEGST